MKIVVTGGAGFIGSYLVDALIVNQHEVHVVDNLATGDINFVNKNAEFHYMDIRDSKLISLIKEIEPQIVFHFAAQVSVTKSMCDPINDSDVNIMGTINLLNACSETGVDRLIFSSSAAVYGLPQFLPVDETHPLNPISPYGVSKLAAEKYIQAYAKARNINYVILRFSNVYGLRQKDSNEGGVVSIFYNRVKAQKSVNIFGDGKQTRDFIYVKDVVNANLSAISCAPNQILNISTGKQTSINTLALTIAKLS